MAQAEQQLARDVLMLPTLTAGFTRTRLPPGTWQIPSQPCTESCGQHSSPLGSSLLVSIPSQHQCSPDKLGAASTAASSESDPRLPSLLSSPPSPAGEVTHLTLVVNCTPVLMTRGRSGCMGMQGCLSTTKALQEQHRDHSQTSLPTLHPEPRLGPPAAPACLQHLFIRFLNSSTIRSSSMGRCCTIGSPL